MFSSAMHMPYARLHPADASLGCSCCHPYPGWVFPVFQVVSATIRGANGRSGIELSATKCTTGSCSQWWTSEAASLVAVLSLPRFTMKIALTSKILGPRRANLAEARFSSCTVCPQDFIRAVCLAADLHLTMSIHISLPILCPVYLHV